MRWVLPAYNEVASIADLIAQVDAVCVSQGWACDIIVVDDGSSDGTARAAAVDHVSVLSSTVNRGLGRALRTGLLAALERAGDGDVIVTLDADLTHDPAYAPAMVDRLDQGVDVVIASRFAPGGEVHGVGAGRRVLSRGASLLPALLRPIPGVRDYSCGFRAYRAPVLARAFERHGEQFISEQGFGCMLEIAQRLRGSATFAEVPFELRYDRKRRASAIRVWPTIRAYVRVMWRVSVDTASGESG